MLTAADKLGAIGLLTALYGGRINEVTARLWIESIERRGVRADSLIAGIEAMALHHPFPSLAELVQTVDAAARRRSESEVKALPAKASEAKINDVNLFLGACAEVIGRGGVAVSPEEIMAEYRRRKDQA